MDKITSKEDESYEMMRISARDDAGKPIIRLCDKGKSIGVIDFGNEVVTFEGNVEESARVFFEVVMTNYFKPYLDDIKKEAITVDREKITKFIAKELYVGDDFAERMVNMKKPLITQEMLDRDNVSHIKNESDK